MKDLVQIFILTFFLQFFGFGQTQKSSDTIPIPLPSLAQLKTGGQSQGQEAEPIRDKRGASVYPVFGTGSGHSGGEQNSFLFQYDPSPFVNYLTGSATSGSHQSFSYAPPPSSSATSNSRPSNSFSVQPIPALGPAPSPFDNTHLNQFNLSPYSMSMMSSAGGGSYGSASTSNPSWAMPSQSTSTNPWAMTSSASTNPRASTSGSSANPWASSSSSSANPWASASNSNSNSNSNPWNMQSSSGSSNPWPSTGSGNPWASSPASSISFGSYGSGSSNRPTVVELPPSYLRAAYSPYHSQISPNFANSGSASNMMASYAMPPGGSGHVLSASALQHTAQQSWSAQNAVINQLLAQTPHSSGYKGGND